MCYNASGEDIVLEFFSISVFSIGFETCLSAVEIGIEGYSDSAVQKLLISEHP